MNALYYSHSGLRYLILLTALAAVIALAYSVSTGRATRVARVLSTTFAGLLDLQMVLGLALLMNGMSSDAVTGHLILMVFAVVVTHGAFMIGQQLANERREAGMRLAGIVIALALIVVGIMAIGRTVLGSAPPPAAYSYSDPISTSERCVSISTPVVRRTGRAADTPSAPEPFTGQETRS